MLILHGPNTVISRKKLIERIENSPGEIVRLEGEKLTLTELKQALESNSLFGQERLVVIENIFARRPSKLKEEILKYLKAGNPPNLIIWEGKNIDGRTLKPFGPTNCLKFAISPLIFKLLDSLSPENKKISLTILHRCLKDTVPELVFFMISRHIRYLIMAADLGEKGLGEFPSWRKHKYIFQAKKFGLKKLVSLYHQLLVIDYQQKTGKAAMTLAGQLDLLIANL